MKTNALLSIKMLAVSIILSCIFVSCNKKPEQIGDNLQPGDSYIDVYYTDTSFVYGYSIIEDSIRTDNPASVLLGSIQDPVFGRTTAGFYTQVRLSTNGHDFGDNPQLDSLVLQLVYSGYYGDTTTLQRVHVYEVEEKLYNDTAYYSTNRVAVGTTDYANYAFEPLPKTPFVSPDGDTVSARVRIPLNVSPELGNKFLSASATDLESSENLKEYFKGIYVVAENALTGGSVLSFNHTTVESQLSIYYHNALSDSLRYDFYIASTEAGFNTFEHDYTTASDPFKNQVLQGDTTLGNQALYLQAMGGVKTILRFPNFTHIGDKYGANKHVVINEAKLILTQSAQQEDFAPTERFALVGLNSDGTSYILPDQYEGTNFFGGHYDKNTKTAQFRITEYIQSLVSGGPESENPGISLTVYSASSTAQRWIMSGNTATTDSIPPLHLKLTYTVAGE